MQLTFFILSRARVDHTSSSFSSFFSRSSSYLPTSGFLRLKVGPLRILPADLLERQVPAPPRPLRQRVWPRCQSPPLQRKLQWWNLVETSPKLELTHRAQQKKGFISTPNNITSSREEKQDVKRLV